MPRATSRHAVWPLEPPAGRFARRRWSRSAILGVMRLAWLLAIACGCGRIDFGARATTDAAIAGDGGTQPDLTQLLPSRVTNLVGYWRMQGDWSDSGPLGNDLVVAVGVPGFSTGTAAVGAEAGQFYDTSLVLANRPALEVSELSFSVWFTSDLISTANSNSGQTLFKLSCATCGGDPDIDIAFATAAVNDGSISTTIGDLPAGSITATTWHHLAGVYSTTGVQLYLDGQLGLSDTSAHTALQTSGGYLWVAELWPNQAPLWNPQYLHGAMEELAIWNTALTASEILSIYANQRP